MQEILAAHARGISFREWNAGPQIDSRMRDEGFNIRIARDPETVKMLGIVFDSLSYNIHISNVKVRSTIQSEINRNSIGVVSAIKRIARVVPESLAKVNEDMKG